jgi:acetyl-CoA carboxylase biotin carboxyl carrier protein
MANKKKSSTKTVAGLPGLELGEMERLVAFMEKHNLQEFEFALGDLRVALKRGGGSGSSSRETARPVQGAAAPAAHSDAGGAASAQAATAAAASSAAAKAADQDHIVKSPIVGTFYASPSPDSEPFVKVGDRVKKGQVVCIVEAMKLMNEIEADVSGEIVRVMAEGGQPVEYGQGLFAIRP